MSTIVLTPRVPLVLVDAAILSSYPLGKPRAQLKRLRDLGDAGRVPADVARGILDLHNALTSLGVDFRVTDCARSIAQQAAARKKYEAWLAAGKPSPKSNHFNDQTMKAAFVAEPGYSMHNARRAIDANTETAVFPNTPANRQLDRMWEVAQPIGWRPIIKAPSEGVSESWHYDFMGDWLPYYERSGDYKTAAMCMCLDIGEAFYGRDDVRMLQAQLQRAGYNCGAVDGFPGAKLSGALAAAGYHHSERDYTKLFSHPTAKGVIWSPS